MKQCARSSWPREVHKYWFLSDMIAGIETFRGKRLDSKLPIVFLFGPSFSFDPIGAVRRQHRL